MKYEHTFRSLKHVYQTDQGGYLMINEREYGPMNLIGDDLAEWEKDFAEIDVFEAPLFAEGTIKFIEEIHEDLTLPDGPYNGMPTGYHLKYTTDSAEKPLNLIHPNYLKWTARMKADPRMHEFREPVWVE
jgi:hypothetical protein